MRYCSPGQRRRDGRRAQRLLDADGPVHRRHRARGPAPAVRALLDQGDARPGAGEVRRAVHAAAARRAWCSTTSTSPRRRGRQATTVLPDRGRSSRYDEHGHTGRRAPRAGRHGRSTAAASSKMSKTEEQRRRPAGHDRRIRRRHRAPVRDVRRRRPKTRRSGPTPASRARRASCAGCGSSPRASRRRMRRARDDVAEPSARPRKALRREIHPCCKQVSYDYERMQYNTVVSGAMKMLNALEDFKPDAARPATPPCCAKALSVLLRVLYPACPHITQALWQRARLRGVARRAARRADGPRSTRRRWCRTRSNSCCRSTASCAAAIRVPAQADKAAIEAAALASPEFAEVRRGQAAEEGGHRAGPAGQRGRLKALIDDARRRASFSALLARRLLAGCGFQLRGAPELPFSRIALAGFAPRSPLADELRRSAGAKRRGGGHAGAGRGGAAGARPTGASAAWSPPPPPGRCANCSCACAWSSGSATPGGARTDPDHRAAADTRHELQRDAGARPRSRKRRRCCARCRPTSSRS